MVSEDGAIYGYNNILVVHLFQKGGDSRAMNPARLDTSSHMYRVAEQSSSVTYWSAPKSSANTSRHLVPRGKLPHSKRGSASIFWNIRFSQYMSTSTCLVNSPMYIPEIIFSKVCFPGFNEPLSTALSQSVRMKSSSLLSPKALKIFSIVKNESHLIIQSSMKHIGQELIYEVKYQIKLGLEDPKQATSCPPTKQDWGNSKWC